MIEMTCCGSRYADVRASMDHTCPAAVAAEIASEILEAVREGETEIQVQDPEPYQSIDMAYFRVTGSDGETYYVQVSKRKRV